jgi:hypothetical protein
MLNGINMSKKLKISIGGYGGEYTVGSLTTEQAFYWLEKDEEELYEHITGFETESSCEDNVYIGQWHDKDDVIHSYGASENNLQIRINFGEEEHVYENLTEFEDIFEMNEVYFENLEECAYLVCYAGEKGCFWEGEIEIEDDVVFDINDFTIMTNDVFGEIFITSVQYKGEELEDGGAGTTGKSFEYRITYPSDELDD